MSEAARANKALTMNTLAFTICFAAWMMNGVLITFLVENRVFDWDRGQMGWLIGMPVLAGSVARLPAGLLTDKYGGRIVFTLLILISAVPMYLVSFADTYTEFLLGGFGFGLCGAGFSVGIAYTSVWFKPERQGLALGIFGAGNAGAAFTVLVAPSALNAFTSDGADLDGWRMLPRLYALTLLLTAAVFYLLTETRKVEGEEGKTMAQRLAPLKEIRVWRFGLYYFLVFGGFVALAQWLVPYYVNVYSMTVATAGLMTAIFSFPSGVIRAFGGWMSDRFGARTIMYWVLGSCMIMCALLAVPRMDIRSPGEGVLAVRSGTVTSVSASRVVVDDMEYALKPLAANAQTEPEGALVLPTSSSWHEPAVEVGDEVKRRALLARGVTRIYFQANIWIFTGLVFLVGIVMGIGKAAVYKHIPEYFPADVGAVGGAVGVLGGLGGFVSPILFGYLLQATGIWTTTWMFLALVSLVALVWMHVVVQRMEHENPSDAVRDGSKSWSQL